MDFPCAGGRNQILAAFSAEVIAQLAPDLEQVELPQGRILHEHAEPVRHVYFPDDSVVCLVASMQQGATIETATIGCEGAVGIATAFGPRRAFTTAIVQMPGLASRIASARFERVAARSETLKMIIIRYQEMVLAQAQQNAACNALHDVEARLAKWLLQTLDRTDRNTLPYTQELLAEVLGVRRATVSDAVQALRAARLIDYRRGEIEIKDRKGLERAACECYDVIRSYIAQFPDTLKDPRG